MNTADPMSPVKADLIKCGVQPQSKSHANDVNGIANYQNWNHHYLIGKGFFFRVPGQNVIPGQCSNVK